MYKIFNLSGELIFKGTNFYYANLSHANLAYADLSAADLSRANLSHADLSYADLSRTDLSYADLFGADLSNANLAYADLSHADLSSADLFGVNIIGARGITSFGPIGEHKRICFVYFHNGIQCRIGCFSGNHNEAISLIRKKYGDNSSYEMMLHAAVWSFAEDNLNNGSV